MNIKEEDMKKLTCLLTAAFFALGAAAQAGAAPAGTVQDDDRMLLVPVPPAPEVARPVKAQKHQKVKKAKHKPARTKKSRK